MEPQAEGADAKPKRAFKPKDGKPKDGAKDGKGAKPPKGPTERIAKVLARAGLASRREVERLIGLGKIAVNGRILETPAVVVSATDVITVEGQPIGKAEPTRLWRYHKPVGLMTTHSDPQGRPTVFEKLPQPLPRVISVGRLDLNSEGLLLLTNDGELARALELPTTAWVRVYRARALGQTTQQQLDRLKNGTTVEGVIYGPMEATLDKKQEKADGRANIWLTVAITEGKNREVRKVLESIGLKVNRLIRLAYGPFQLGNLESGEVEEVGPRVIRELLSDKIDPRNLPPEGSSQTKDAPRLRSETTGRRGGGDRFRKDEDARPSRERKVGDGPRVRREFEDKREFKERDFDERPRFEGDGEARDRRPQREYTPRFDRGSGDKKPWTPRPESRERDRDAPRREWKPRAEGAGDGEKKAWKPREGGSENRSFAKKPYRPGGEGGRFKPREGLDEAGAYERAKREFGGGSDRPRNEGSRNEGSRDDRPKRDFGDRPRAAAPQGDRKPFRSRDDRPSGDRPFKPREDRGDKPRFDRSQGERPFKPREDRGDRPRFDRPQGGRPQGDRPQGERAFKPREDREGGERKSYGDRKPFRSDRPRDDRASGDRPFKPREDRGDKPRFDRPRSDRPSGDRPFKPREDREGGDRKSYGARSDGPRSEGPRSGGKPGGFGGKPGGFKPGGGFKGGGKPGGFAGKPRRDRD